MPQKITFSKVLFPCKCQKMCKIQMLRNKWKCMMHHITVVPTWIWGAFNKELSSSPSFWWLGFKTLCTWKKEGKNVMPISTPYKDAFFNVLYITSKDRTKCSLRKQLWSQPIFLRKKLYVLQACLSMGKKGFEKAYSPPFNYFSLADLQG